VLRVIQQDVDRLALHAHTHVQRLSTMFGDMFTYRVGDVPISTIREPPQSHELRSFYFCITIASLDADC
jgi:hypothetical protein